MLARVSEMMARFRMSTPGERIGVACSGGPDSVALLEALSELAPSLGIGLGVVHLNHRLRGGASDADEAFVRELAKKRGLDAHVENLDVAELAESEGRNLEEAGRLARYAWFGRLLDEGIFDRIATGHTRSDQAETVLFRLLRGTGPEGLSAIRPVREPGVIRPLLGVERAEVEAFLAERGVAYRVDESNADPRFARNRIRRDLIPLLERDWNPRTPQALARLAEQAAEDADYWRARLEECEARLLRAAAGGIVFSADQVCSLEPALRRRVLRRALERVGGKGRYDYQHLEAVRRLLERPAGGARLSLPGLTAERSCRKVRLIAADEPSVTLRSESETLEPPDERTAPDGRTRIRIEIRPQHGGHGSYTKANWDPIDWSKAPKPLVLRRWRPGDRVAVGPSSAPRKLSDLLQAADVAAWDREGWPVLAPKASGSASECRIVWARGFGASMEFRPSGNIGEVLRVFEFDEAGRAWTGPENWGRISAGLFV
jgi:tRNA(Ile)-lysidine synthase